MHAQVHFAKCSFSQNLAHPVKVDLSPETLRGYVHIVMAEKAFDVVLNAYNLASSWRRGSLNHDARDIGHVRDHTRISCLQFYRRVVILFVVEDGFNKL